MRPRTKDRHLPACVYQKHGAYWLVKKGKWIRLGADLNAALHEYARQISVPTNGLPSLIDKALPFLIAEKAKSTQAQYTYSAKLLKKVFAEFHADQVKHGDIVQMMDAYSSTVAIANRLLTVLKLTYQWALDRNLVEINPCVSVKRLKQYSRDRLISEAEFRAIYSQAAPWLQIVIDLCYLTGQRIGDILSLQRQQLLDEGIFFEQQKTGKRLIVGWTPELRAVIDRAKKEAYGVAAMQYLLAGRGGRLRLHSNVWRCFKTAAQKAGIDNVTLHDLRAMSGTDAEKQGIDPMALLGHTDSRTTRIYLRDKTTKVVSGPRRKAG